MIIICFQDSRGGLWNILWVGNIEEVFWKYQGNMEQICWIYQGNTKDSLEEVCEISCESRESTLQWESTLTHYRVPPRKHLGSIKEILRKYQGNFKYISRKHQGNVNGMSRNIKEISRKCQENIKEISNKYQIVRVNTAMGVNTDPLPITHCRKCKNIGNIEEIFWKYQANLLNISRKYQGNTKETLRKYQRKIKESLESQQWE